MKNRKRARDAQALSPPKKKDLRGGSLALFPYISIPRFGKSAYQVNT
jgi:hypothetical protein